MMKIKGKKAGIFAVGMVVGMIIFISLSWYSFSATNRNLNLGMSKSISSFQYQNIHDKMYLYIVESSKLAASQAFYEIAKDSAINRESASCTVIGDTIIWNQNCMPEQKFIDNEFLEKYNLSFINFIKNYPEQLLEDREYFYLIEDDELFSVTSEKTISGLEKASFAVYNISYSFDPSIVINLSEENMHLKDFEFIYKQAEGAVTECKDSDSIALCVKNKMNLERWTTEVKKEGSYLVFECKTKKYFFFYNDSEKFDQIAIAFAMAII